MFGNKIQGYRNSKRMAVNGMVERLCKGYMDLWDSFVGERRHVRARWPASEWKGGSSF